MSIFEIGGRLILTLSVMDVAAGLEKRVSLKSEQEERDRHAGRDHHYR